jgi:type IV secretory pathway VirB6-like protein
VVVVVVVVEVEVVVVEVVVVVVVVVVATIITIYRDYCYMTQSASSTKTPLATSCTKINYIYFEKHRHALCDKSQRIAMLNQVLHKVIAKI